MVKNYYPVSLFFAVSKISLSFLTSTDFSQFTYIIDKQNKTKM